MSGADEKGPPALPGELMWQGHDGAFPAAITVEDKRLLLWFWTGEEWAPGSPEIVYRAAFLAERARADAAIRARDRLLHGQDIEGDAICPNEVEAARQKERADKLAARIAKAGKLLDGCGHGEDCPHRYCESDCDGGEDCQRDLEMAESCDCYLHELRAALDEG